MNRIGESELILNANGSIFHLHLKPENLADNVILVGDQGRVEMVSKYFDTIEFEVQNREFKTHTGIFNGKRVTVLSTGIGTDNIDIVVNELDALVNIDLEKRIPKTEHKTLNLIRIGTSGALQGDIPVDTPVISETSIGFDGLLNFYQGREKLGNENIENAFKTYTNWNKNLPAPYFADASKSLVEKIGEGMIKGITISAPGFYGPQGRVLRLQTVDPNLNDKITAFEYEGRKITNFEMESSAIAGLSVLLGHNALTVCSIIANRIRKEYSQNYKVAVDKLVKTVLERLTN
ncbi:MAG: nucleoside phosphorylase [Bacteroidales bacterium]|nr:nucleoside phosphorylase [Bacteroidales bacterium]